MTDEYFDEMRKFGHEDEMRYRILMRGKEPAGTTKT